MILLSANEMDGIMKAGTTFTIGNSNIFFTNTDNNNIIITISPLLSRQMFFAFRLLFRILF